MHQRLWSCGLVGVIFIAVGGWAEAQSLSERISSARQKIASQSSSNPSAQAELLNRQKMQRLLPTVDLDNLTAENAMAWLENISGLKFLVSWERLLEEEGISGETEVVVVGQNLTVEAALDMILKQVTLDVPLMWEVTPWYIRVVTKTQADANPVIRIYPIGDLLITVPNFTNAPDFDLQSISQSGSGGGGGGGGGSSLFDDTDDEDEEGATRVDRAEDIAALIRDSVEPDIWRANGGLHSAVTVYQDSLIVRAPEYVHRQIGGDRLPVLGGNGSIFSPSSRSVRPGVTTRPRETFRERRRHSPDTLYRDPTELRRSRR